MSETDDTQRFDRLLEVMVTKPSLDVKAKDEPTEEDLREDDEG